MSEAVDQTFDPNPEFERVDRDPLPEDHPLAINDILAILDSTFLSARAAARPSTYSFAVSVVCNIKCPFCSRQTLPESYTSGFMAQEAFLPFLPHLEVSRRTGLFGLGEPFLNKKFFDWLVLAKRSGTYCQTSTHGMSLTDEMIEKILDSGLDELNISIDGATPRTFNFLRNGADFKTVIRNVTRLSTRRKERGLDKPRLHIAATISKYNVWQMKSLVRLTKQIGGDLIGFSNIIFDNPEHVHANVVGTRIFAWNLKRADREAKKLGLPIFYFYQHPYGYEPAPAPPPTEERRYGCTWAWSNMVVTKEGNLKPCTYMSEAFGSTARGPVEPQFNSEELVDLRQRFIDRNYHPKCLGCGLMKPITSVETDKLLAEAARRIDTGNFSERVREELRTQHRFFSKLAEEAATPALAK